MSKHAVMLASAGISAALTGGTNAVAKYVLIFSKMGTS